MQPCFRVEIQTPKRYLLNGLWFGPKKPKRVIIFVHGLTGSVFSGRNIVDALVDGHTAVLAFNNRGFGKVNNVKRKVRTKTKTIIAGSAHEVFTDCVDDVQGAIDFVRRHKVKSMFLIGHSSGCQKSVYWAAKTKSSRAVQGIVLLAPVSDYAAALYMDTGRLKKAVQYARALVRRGRGHDLLPPELLTTWSLDDAQRFLSLYTPDSIEEIFSYSQEKKDPRILKSVRVPMLVLWAERDEYSDQPAKKVAEWFEKHLRAPHQVEIVPNVSHGFKGAEKKVGSVIRRWMETSIRS